MKKVIKSFNRHGLSRNQWNALASAVQWVFQTSLERSVAPNAEHLKQHEFESVASRRGGYGNVF